MFYNTFATQIGQITLATDGKHLTELHIQDDKYFTQIPADWEYATNHPVLVQANSELQEYFTKQRGSFTVPILVKGTPFQQTVWKALQEIPPGTTVTYMHIAEKIGKPSAIRAVGTAIGRNPMCIFIPCHRVMGSDGKFHGYVAGVDRKKYLLELEGMKFDTEEKQLDLSFA